MSMYQDLNDLRVLLRQQHGLLTAVQAHRSGIPRSQVRHRLESGRWRAVLRGVYAVSGGALTEEMALTSALLFGGAYAVLSHQSAANQWGTARGNHEDPVHITVPYRCSARNPVPRPAIDGLLYRPAEHPGVIVHRTRAFAHIAVDAGWPLTAKVDTAIDLSAAEASASEARVGLIRGVGCSAAPSEATMADRVALGFFVGLVPFAGPYLTAGIDVLRAIPATALVPVALLALGPAVHTEVALAVYAALWPVVLGTAAGVAAVHPRQRDGARVLHLSRAATVRKIVVPAALPGWLAGARMAAIAALLVATVAEVIIWPRGLGGGLSESLHALDPARMWVYALTCGVLGVVLNASLRWAVDRTAPAGSGRRGSLEWRCAGCWCSPRRRWHKVVLPTLAPSILLGIRLAAALALIVALLVDVVGAGKGLGRLLVLSQQSFDPATAWGLVLVVGTLGFLPSVAVVRIEALLVRQPSVP